MIQPSTLRKRLSVKLSEDDVFELLMPQYGPDRNILMTNLFRCLTDSGAKIARNAAWLMGHVDNAGCLWLEENLGKLMSIAMATPDTAMRRLLLNALLRLDFTASDLRVDFLNFCYERMTSDKEATSVRVLAMKLVYKLCCLQPELLGELRTVLEQMDPYMLAQGVKTARKNVLNDIETASYARKRR